MRLISVLILVVPPGVLAADRSRKPRPLMRDFIGLNGHTVQFKPDLYSPVAKLIRDYHPLKWDVGDDTSFLTTFPPPASRGLVESLRLWLPRDCASMRAFSSMTSPGEWKNLSRDAGAYGEAFARAFGPSGRALVESIEIGNDPANIPMPNIASSLRPWLAVREKEIPDCALRHVRSTSPEWSLFEERGLGARSRGAVHILTIHLTAEVEPWPTCAGVIPKTRKRSSSSIFVPCSPGAPNTQPTRNCAHQSAGTQRPNHRRRRRLREMDGSTELQQAQWIVRVADYCGTRPRSRLLVFLQR